MIKPYYEIELGKLLPVDEPSGGILLKALSLWQPWASLVALGAKRFETRSWATPYKGPLVICASKKLVVPEPDVYPEDAVIVSALIDAGIEVGELPLGKALCMVDLVGCIRTATMTPEQIGADAPFGDFSLNRFAWKMENVRTFKEPFPVRGRQGIFDIRLTGSEPGVKQLSGKTGQLKLTFEKLVVKES